MNAADTTKTTLAIALLIAIAGIAACNGPSSSDRRKNTDPPAPAAPVSPPPEPPHDIKVTRPAFQAKSSAQLARSLEACVGPDAVWVTPSMIASQDNTNTAAFLTPDFTDGDNIIEVQTSLFDGTVEAMRTGVRVDQVSLEYLTALKNVANVAATRCTSDLVSKAEMCVCETDAEAKAMLMRCLAGVADPTTPAFAELTKDFAAKCKTNRGSAIASMIASLAFAKVP